MNDRREALFDGFHRQLRRSVHLAANDVEEGEPARRRIRLMRFELINQSVGTMRFSDTKQEARQLTLDNRAGWRGIVCAFRQRKRVCVPSLLRIQRPK